LLSYTDAEIYRDGGLGGFEIRTFIAAAGAAKGGIGTTDFCEPIPIFAVSCTTARMALAA
jgi:2,3-dihydroxyphenylpropionate 1,2-dioxygenase